MLSRLEVILEIACCSLPSSLRGVIFYDYYLYEKKFRRPTNKSGEIGNLSETVDALKMCY